MSILKHRKQTNFPTIQTQGDGLRETFDGTFRASKQAFLNIFDDLTRLDSPNSDGIQYYGDSSTNGTWRIVATPTRFSIQLLESGTWTEKLFASP